MRLSERERRALNRIDRGLMAEEPRLHRALTRMSSEPLPNVPLRPVPAAAPRHPRLRLAVVLLVLCAGMAALVVGELLGSVALTVPGALVSGLGPPAACWLLRH